MSNQSSPSPRDTIERFNQADLALTLAVATDCQRDIEETSKAWEERFENALALNVSDKSDRLMLADFLGERFLLSENCSPDMKRKAMEKVRSLIAESLAHPAL